MNYIINVYEDNHGYIGTAANYLSAIDLLIKDNWLDENEIIDEGISVKEKYGENWKQEIEKLPMREFNNIFIDRFGLIKEYVYNKYESEEEK